MVNNSVGMDKRTNLLVSYQLYDKVVGMTVIVTTINMISRFCYLYKTYGSYSYLD